MVRLAERSRLCTLTMHLKDPDYVHHGVNLAPGRFEPK